MPIIRNLRLYRCSQHVAHNLGYSRSLVWCVAVGYATGLRDVARVEQHPSAQTHNLEPCTRTTTCYNQCYVPHGVNICIVSSF